MKIEKIVWPTDLSENASKALPYVTSLAQQYQAEIHILYVVVEYVAFGAAYGDTNPEEDFKRMLEWERETADKQLDERNEKFLESCPHYIRNIDVGDPSQKNLNKVKKEKTAMV